LRNRKHHISGWLNDKEYAHLQKMIAASGMKTDPLLRHLIMGKEIKPKSNEGWPELLRQVSAVGNNVNQLARVANTTGTVDQETIERVIQMQTALWRRMMEL
jgi:hypothetical protein